MGTNPTINRGLTPPESVEMNGEMQVTPMNRA